MSISYRDIFNEMDACVSTRFHKSFNKYGTLIRIAYFLFLPYVIIDLKVVTDMKIDTLKSH